MSLLLRMKPRRFKSFQKSPKPHKALSVHIFRAEMLCVQRSGQRKGKFLDNVSSFFSPLLVHRHITDTSPLYRLPAGFRSLSLVPLRTYPATCFTEIYMCPSCLLETKWTDTQCKQIHKIQQTQNQMISAPWTRTQDSVLFQSFFKDKTNLFCCQTTKQD